MASLLNLRNLDLRLNPIMTNKVAPDDGSSLGAEAPVVLNRTVEVDGRSDPRAIVLAALPRLANLNGLRVTSSERIKLRGCYHPSAETVRVCHGPLSPTSRPEDEEDERLDSGPGSDSGTPSLAAVVGGSRRVRSGFEVGQREASGNGRWISRDDVYRVVGDGSPTGVGETIKTHDHVGAGGGVSADVMVAERSEKNGNAWVKNGETGSGPNGDFTLANSRCDRRQQRSGAPLAVCKAETSCFLSMGDTNGSGNGHDDGDDDLAALWRELDAGSLALRRAAVMPKSAPRSESQQELSFSTGSSPPETRDTRLLVAELNASQGDTFREEDTAKPGKLEEHPITVPKEGENTARGVGARHNNESTITRTMLPPYDPSTAAAARALEAFRRSSQRLGLGGVAIMGGVGTAAAPASGGRKESASVEMGVITGVTSGNNAAIVGGNQAGSKAEVVVTATHFCAPSVGVSGSAGEDARVFGSGDVGGLIGANEFPKALTNSTERVSRDKSSPSSLSISAVAVGNYKECGVVKSEAEAGDDGDNAAGVDTMRKGEGRGHEGREIDERFRQREAEFEERWKAREREFDEKWAAREREFEEMRREESKVMIMCVRCCVLFASLFWISQLLTKFQINLARERLS